MTRPIHDLFIQPDYDHARVRATFTAPKECRAARWAVLDKGKTLQEGEVKFTPGAEASFEAPMEGFKPWNINTPHLYTLRLTLDLPGGTTEMTERFGMRKIHVSGDAIFVNNERFFVRGFIRGREAHDHPNLMGLPLTEYYAKNIRAAKAYGFNFIRFHSRVPPRECFEMADELGIFIHVELRQYYGKYQKERALMNDAGDLVEDADWTDMVLANRNHPSLMVYCIGNEIRHPGTNPRVAYLSKLAKSLDPTRLFIDTCAHGEFDRENVDIDVQHMSYFYPFAKDYDMFENTQNWLVFGSCTGLPVTNQDRETDWSWRVTRAIPSRWPVLAHEICHYVALHDLDALDAKFDRYNPSLKPWWVGELRKLVALKGMAKDYPRMLAASRRFQFLGWKLGIEGARRSRLLAGFHFLQFSDTERYENGNGVVDCFDDSKGVDEQAFRRFNGDTVLLADLPRRTFFEGECVSVPIILSHFSADISGMADLRFTLKSKDSKAVSIEGGLDKINLNARGRREIGRVTLVLPKTARPLALGLEISLVAEGRTVTENSWDLWLYPDRPEALPDITATVALDEVDLSRRYPQIINKGTPAKPQKLLIVNRFTAEVLRHLERGGDVLMLYRVPETRDRKTPAPRERYGLTTTWDRFKAVIWDRGTNCGAFIRKSAALAGFPNDGYMDLQFHGIVDDCDKITLDDFPVKVEPIIEGVDKAVRDRFDVKTYRLSELQPKYTMRRFAYLFEVKVGKGRLLVTGLNMTGIAQRTPEACAMFESLVRYVTSARFKPKAAIATKDLEAYLLRKGREPLVKERRMTQFWQLNDQPLELKSYWDATIEYLGEPVTDEDARRPSRQKD